MSFVLALRALFAARESRALHPGRRSHAILPEPPDLSDQIEGTCHEYHVVRARGGQRLLDGLFSVANYTEAPGMVPGHFREQPRRNRPRRPRVRKDHLGRKWKERTGDFIRGFVAQRTENQPDRPPAEILLPERRDLAR